MCVGICIVDFFDREVFVECLKINLVEKNCLFEKMYDSIFFEFDDIFEEYYEYG